MAVEPGALRTYLCEQAGVVRAAGVAVATGTDESVHDLRVAIRRVRSALRTFVPVLPEEETLELDLRLKQASAMLGLVRDLEVLDEVLAAEAAGPLRDREREAARAALARRQELVRAELVSPRHERLVADLRLYVDALAPEADELRRLARGAARKAKRQLARAGQDPIGLHRARVAAKRARYAAEVTGNPKRARRLKQVTDGLGIHHDCHLAAGQLRSLDVTGAEAVERDRILAHLDLRAEEGRLAGMRSI